MYHSIVLKRSIARESDSVSQVLRTLTFRTSDIIGINFSTNDGIPDMAWLNLKGSDSYSWSRGEGYGEEVEMLSALSAALHQNQSYFTDEQGNIFPFDKILYVNATKHGFVLAPGIEISLHPTKEWPVFKDLYINWMDLSK